jgi:hypothetical protein
LEKMKTTKLAAKQETPETIQANECARRIR